jgi:hypothetical protein
LTLRGVGVDGGVLGCFGSAPTGKNQKRKRYKTMAHLGIGHITRALQSCGFGHEEIMALRQFMLDNKAKEMGLGRTFAFFDDCYSEEWQDNFCIIKEVRA